MSKNQVCGVCNHEFMVSDVVVRSDCPQCFSSNTASTALERWETEHVGDQALNMTPCLNPADDDLTVPDDDETRKALPIATGVLDYFPDALLAIAEVSRKGNDQHNPGQPLHWSRGKSADHANSLMRHFIDRGKFDSKGVRHTAQIAWRALAMLQSEIDGKP